jgi:hypothetical protein
MDRIITELQIQTQIGICGIISGLLSKSGSKDQYDIINRLRNLLVDLSREALRDMNIGRNQRAKRLLTVLSEVGK